MISYGVLTAFAKALQFLLLPLLTRLFSPSDYGLIDFMATVAGLLTILITLSLESAVARMWHEMLDHNERQRLLTSVIFFICVFGTVLFFAGWAISAVLTNTLPKLQNLEMILPVVIGTTVLLSISTVPQMVLRMERNIFRFGIIQIANSALGIAFSLTLILHFGMGLLGLFVGYLAAAAIVLCLSIYWTWQYLQLEISRSDLSECLKYSVPLVPAVFLNWFNSQVDRLILLSLLGLSVVGVYGAAAKVATIITVLVEVFRLSWLPIAFSHINKPSRDAFFRNSLITYVAVMAFVGLLLTSYSREVLTLLTTSDYSKGYPLIPWLVGTQIFLGSCTVTNVGMLISKKTSRNSIAAVLGTAVNIFLGLVLVSGFGVGGAAIGTFVAAIFITSLLLYFSLRLVDIPFDVIHALAIAALYVITSVSQLLLYESLIQFSVLARTVVLAFTVGIIIILTARALRNPVPMILPSTS